MRPMNNTAVISTKFNAKSVCAAQVGAHGTGATIPPVDEQVVAMKLVTPALGTLHLSEVSSSPPPPGKTQKREEKKSLNRQVS